MIADVAHWILSLSGGWAIAVVFLGPALESSVFLGIVFPGEIAVILGGVLAYSGRVSLASVLIAAVAGAIVGDTVGYWVGREWGHRILRWIGRRIPFLKHRVDDDIERARAFIRRRGGVAVFLGRFAAALRATVPGLAGMSDLHYPTFLAYNALGGVVWATAFVLLGYFAGAAWERAASYASRIGVALLVLIVVALIAGRVLRRLRERGEALPDRLARTRPVAWFRELHPPTAAWLAGRVDTSTPRGLAVSASVAIGAASTWLFGAMIQDIRAHEEAALLDAHLLRFVVEHRVAWLSAAARAVIGLGSGVVVIPVVVVVAFSIHERKAHAGVVMGAAVLGAEAIARVAQSVVAHRPPAAAARLMDMSGFSFPSTPATLAVAGWGAVAVLASLGRPRVRLPVFLLAVVVAVTVAAADLYAATAWWTDVVGGVSLGAACLCAGLAVVLWSRSSVS